MLWTIINEADVFYSPKSICENNAVRSSDPYSYIKTGYHWITLGYLEELIMWILTSIFQAIGQALTWVLPVSESGHSVIFHNFSGRFSNACSQLTGVVHIGIAIGLFIAFYKLFVNLFKNFFGTFDDIFHKKLDLKNITPQRNFMYMTVLSFMFLSYMLFRQENTETSIWSFTEPRLTKLYSAKEYVWLF